MKTLTVYVSVGLVGCKRECQIEVEDDSTDEEIEEAAREALWTMIEWGWRGPKKRSER